MQMAEATDTSLLNDRILQMGETEITPVLAFQERIQLHQLQQILQLDKNCSNFSIRDTCASIFSKKKMYSLNKNPTNQLTSEIFI